MLTPGHPAPTLSLPTLEHGTLDTGSRDGWSLLIFYRGLHCPICLRELTAASGQLDAMDALGLDVTAISADDEDRARATQERAGTGAMRIAHSLPLTSAREDWGLWISAAREGSQEPERFSEPGHVVISPDGAVWAAWIQSTPFARPPLDDILGGIRFAQEKGYPPRGAYDGPLAA